VADHGERGVLEIAVQIPSFLAVRVVDSRTYHVLRHEPLTHELRGFPRAEDVDVRGAPLLVVGRYAENGLNRERPREKHLGFFAVSRYHEVWGKQVLARQGVAFEFNASLRGDRVSTRRGDALEYGVEVALERSLQDPHSERARPSPPGVPEESLGRGDEREGVGRRELESQALEDVLRHIAQGESVGGR
jgi:hypothetical protein